MRLLVLAITFLTCALDAEASTTILFVGGTGGRTPAPTLDSLRERLAEADPESTWIVFTGDYTRKGAFPHDDDDDRDRAEEDVRVHLRAVQDFVARGGTVFFIPGEREYHDGRGEVRRLRRYINRELEQIAGTEVDAMPVADCGDLHVVDLGPNVALALLNSPWWMLDWESHPKTNEGCDVKSRAEFREEFNSLAKKYRTRRLLVAVHHPLESLGPFGGNFDAIDHLVPPIFGSLAIWARQGGLIPQYRNHVMYDSIASSLLTSAQTFGSFVFASGHDRSLQVLNVDDQLQLVAGHSGPEPTRVNSPDEGEFAKAVAGWLEVRLQDSGEGWAVVFDGPNADELNRVALPPLPELVESGLTPARPLPEGPVTSRYTTREVKKTGLLRSWVVGDFYRDSYALDLEFDVLDLGQFGGGLTPVSIGGGSQTNSIRFVDPTGVQWAARAATKDSTRYLPYPLNRVPAIRYFLEEGFTGIHPSAATTVPVLAEALDVLHTNPKLYYLPDQDGLGDYRGFISDQVVVLERRPEEPEEGELPAHLGGGLSPVGRVKYSSTTKTLDRVRAKPWKHRIDQEGWLKARLLDIFLGDWDRHQDQWRFARLTMEDDSRWYRPVPRDRDQACAHYDGAFLFIARMAIPAIRRLRPFEEEIGDITWLTYNARPVDSIFLSRVGYERWMEIAREVQETLTDDVIARGMATWPKAAYEIHGRDIETKLRSRREGLIEAAERFFYQVNEAIEVLGSEKADRIELDYLDSGRLSVRIKRKKDGAAGEPFYERTFLAEQTEEIRIFALDGKDELVVTGKPHSGIDLRFVGGTGEDRVMSGSGTELSASAIAVYDRRGGMKIDEAISVSDERSSDPYRNQYDFNDPHHEPNTFGALPSLLFNADDGVLVSVSSDLVVSGFKRIPYRSSHTLSAAVATTTAGLRASYRGHVPRSLGTFDQEIDLAGTTPLYTRNFFGFTSEFVDPSVAPGGRDFFRVRQSQLALRYGLIGKTLRDTMRFGVRGLAELVDIEATDGRFVVVAPEITELSLRSRLFAGGQAFVELGTIDNPSYPKRGLFAQLATTARSDITRGSADRIGTSALFSAVAGTYIPFDRSQRFVLATRARLQQIVGDFPFYFAPTLGDQDLRAYNDEQLAGNGVFAHSTDLRVELARFEQTLPGSIGFAASIDHGFAFGSDVANENYNVIVGGSVFWSILDLVGLQVSYYRGLDQGTRFMASIGPLLSQTGMLP